MDNQKKLAQYFTSQSISDFMVSLFSDKNRVKALDPGAGEGILGLTLMKEVLCPDSLQEISFVEIDPSLIETLSSNINQHSFYKTPKVLNEDFIKTSIKMYQSGKRFTHIIMNPPYFKLSSKDTRTELLEKEGIHVTNIYAAFMWLSLRLLEPGGELVSIIPRSFCNGLYFRDFRDYILRDYSIEQIHIFKARNKVFFTDKVLQENIIIKIANKTQNKRVKISSSTDNLFDNFLCKEVSFDNILNKNDRLKIIRIAPGEDALKPESLLTGNLSDLDLSVSTGPIVHFRCKDRIFDSSQAQSIPLLHPFNIDRELTKWPIPPLNKKGQHYGPKVGDKQIFPMTGAYVIVKRISSKEERHRIHSSVVFSRDFRSNKITFENHLNYFHRNKKGFEEKLAEGLCVYLNSSLLDQHFRELSGSTQVNVGDLKNLSYPSRQALLELAEIQNKDPQIREFLVREILVVRKSVLHKNKT